MRPFQPAHRSATSGSIALQRPLHSRFPLRSGPYRLNEIEAICPGPKQRSAQRAGWCRVSMVFAHYKLWFQPDTGKEKL